MLRPLGAAILLCSNLTSCASVDSLGVATLEEQRALISDAATTSPNLQPGEKIKVTVFGEDRLSGEYEIDPGGSVSLPLAGTIKAAGLSQYELEVALTKKFQGEYLRDPKVTVEVANFRPFYILGEVAKPGEYPYNIRNAAPDLDLRVIWRTLCRFGRGEQRDVSAIAHAMKWRREAKRLDDCPLSGREQAPEPPATQPLVNQAP